MKKRKLGRTGIEVSEIAFGGVEIGLPYGIGVKSKTDMLTESQAVRLLHSAVDSGINFFDTARMYGASEAIMGKAFKSMREQVVICSKCAHLRDETGRLPSAEKLKRIIENSLKESLKALQCEYIDVYLLHQADAEILANDTVKNLFLKFKEQGLIRAAGVSTYETEETKTAIESGAWDVIQLPFNLMNQSHKKHFASAQRRGIGIMVRSVLFKGILTRKGRNLHPALKKVEDHLKLYNELLDGSIADLPALATKFALSFKEVSSVLVGIDRPQYLQNSLTAADGHYLNKKRLARAQELQYPDPQFLDLVKWDKMGWLT